MREVAIALADLPAFVEDVRKVHAATVKAGALPYGMGLWMRFARGTSNLLGTAHGRDTVYVELAAGRDVSRPHVPLKHLAFYEVGCEGRAVTHVLCLVCWC